MANTDDTAMRDNPGFTRKAFGCACPCASEWVGVRACVCCMGAMSLCVIVCLSVGLYVCLCKRKVTPSESVRDMISYGNISGIYGFFWDFLGIFLDYFREKRKVYGIL